MYGNNLKITIIKTGQSLNPTNKWQYNPFLLFRICAPICEASNTHLLQRALLGWVDVHISVMTNLLEFKKAKLRFWDSIFSSVAMYFERNYPLCSQAPNLKSWPRKHICITTEKHFCSALYTGVGTSSDSWQKHRNPLEVSWMLMVVHYPVDNWWLRRLVS